MEGATGSLTHEGLNELKHILTVPPNLFSSTPTAIFVMSCPPVKPSLYSLQGRFLAGHVFALSESILEPEHFLLPSFLIDCYLFLFVCILPAPDSTQTENSQELRTLQALNFFFTSNVVIHRFRSTINKGGRQRKDPKRLKQLWVPF